MGKGVFRELSQVFTVEQKGNKKHLVRNISLAISVGFLSAWFLVMFCSVTTYVDCFDGPEPALNRAYISQSAAFAIFCVVLYKQNKSSSFLVESKALSLPLGSLLGIGSIVLSFSSVNASTLWLMVGIGSFLTAASAAMLFSILAHRFSLLSYKERLVYSVVAFGLTAIMLGISSLVQKTPAAMYAMGIAFVSGIALAISDWCKIDAFNEESVVETQDFVTVAKRKMLLRFGLLVFIWRMVVEWARTMLIRGGINEAGNTLFAQIHALGTIVVVVSALVIIIMLAVIPKRFRLSYVYRVILLTSICAVLFTQIAFDESSKILPYALTSGTTVLLMMITWAAAVLLIDLTDKHNPSQVILLAVGMSYSGGAVGFILGQCFDSFLAHTPLVFIVCEVICVCALVMSYVSLFTEKDLDFVSRILPNSQRHHFMDHCKNLASEYGLSEREEEILVMLAKGRNAAYIQQTLFISYNTATTHRKRIYQKLGVHSQQELMDFVEKGYERF